MKPLYFFIAFFMVVKTTDAQTIGAKLGAQIEFPQIGWHGYVYSTDIGFFLDQPVVGRLGISTGLEHLYTEFTDETSYVYTAGTAQVVNKIFIKSHDIRLPFYLTFDVMRNAKRTWHGTLIGGFNVETSLRYYSKESYDGQLVSQHEGGVLFNRTAYFNTPIRAGLEVTHVFPNTFCVSIGALGHRSFDMFAPIGLRLNDLVCYTKIGYSLHRKSVTSREPKLNNN